jgi:hypothetical protein
MIYLTTDEHGWTQIFSSPFVKGAGGGFTLQRASFGQKRTFYQIMTISKYGDKKETPSEESLENPHYVIFLFQKVTVRLTLKNFFCIALFARNFGKFL